ncbi:hypothetical protein FRC00_005413, partial [Tulasnella sp. 408]
KVQSSYQYGQAKSKSGLSTKLTIAKTTFNTVEAVSGAIPLVAVPYLIRVSKGMDSNEEVAKTLESRMSTLAEHLEYFKSRPQENQNEQVNERIKNLQ